MLASVLHDEAQALDVRVQMLLLAEGETEDELQAHRRGHVRIGR